ncbi:hypothetical protein PROFUN_00151 [Planoprotostelium fungivorum]|uniref:Uncharacterized protein n=1 Tax=Planoprotostelium fungivorum TaxID=1890364 RepID=A0A2P6P0U6_9EUKA|nr:hypothetical protein PROFUN_00151 [Planoprotostelium fungivorum]
MEIIYNVSENSCGVQIHKAEGVQIHMSLLWTPSDIQKGGYFEKHKEAEEMSVQIGAVVKAMPLGEGRETSEREEIGREKQRMERETVEREEFEREANEKRRENTGTTSKQQRGFTDGERVESQLRELVSINLTRLPSRPVTTGVAVFLSPTLIFRFWREQSVGQAFGSSLFCCVHFSQTDNRWMTILWTYMVKMMIKKKENPMAYDTQPDVLDTTKRGEEYLREVYDWQPSGLIDFGDASVCDPMYDLVPFTSLSSAAMRNFTEDASNHTIWTLMREPGIFSWTMMYTLLHQCNAMATVYRWKPCLIRMLKQGDCHRDEIRTIQMDLFKAAPVNADVLPWLGTAIPRTPQPRQTLACLHRRDPRKGCSTPARIIHFRVFICAAKRILDILNLIENEKEQLAQLLETRVQKTKDAVTQRDKLIGENMKLSEETDELRDQNVQLRATNAKMEREVAAVNEKLDSLLRYEKTCAKLSVKCRRNFSFAKVKVKSLTEENTRMQTEALKKSQMSSGISEELTRNNDDLQRAEHMVTVLTA